MFRTYSVKYKSKSKMPSTPEEADKIRQTILNETAAADVEILDDGQIVRIDAAEEDFPEVMNMVVNVFRRLDDKSEVSYKFALNRE